MGYRYWDMFYVNEDEAANGVVSHEPMQRDLEAFGFGSRPGWTSVRAGRTGPRRRVEATIHEAYPESFPEGEWFPGDFILMTIGQGDTLVTPLQLATAFGALENDGKICVPHVLDRVVAPDETLVREYQQNCRRRVRIDERHLRYVRDALTGTVTGGGTAGCVRRVPVRRRLGGREDRDGRGRPQAGLLVVRGDDGGRGTGARRRGAGRAGGHGATTAAPIVRHIIEGIYGLEFSQFTDVEGTD